MSLTSAMKPWAESRLRLSSDSVSVTTPPWNSVIENELSLRGLSTPSRFCTIASGVRCLNRDSRHCPDHVYNDLGPWKPTLLATLDYGEPVTGRMASDHAMAAKDASPPHLRPATNRSRSVLSPCTGTNIRPTPVYPDVMVTSCPRLQAATRSTSARAQCRMATRDARPPRSTSGCAARAFVARPPSTGSNRLPQSAHSPGKPCASLPQAFTTRRRRVSQRRRAPEL
jgi:hypothetical protein